MFEGLHLIFNQDMPARKTQNLKLILLLVIEGLHFIVITYFSYVTTGKWHWDPSID